MISILRMVILYGYVKLLQGTLHNMVIVEYIWNEMRMLYDVVVH